MVIKQISVFLENKAGRLAKVAEELKNNHINIRALTIADTSDFGILRMIVNKPDQAYRCPEKRRVTVRESGILAIELDDKEGVFHELMKLCDANGLNVEYTYSFVEQYPERLFCSCGSRITIKPLPCSGKTGTSFLPTTRCSESNARRPQPYTNHRSTLTGA